VRLTYAGRVVKDAPAAARQAALPMVTTRPMSEEQRRVALQLSGGHQVLQGVAGSGKSEVVAARARILADANPAWRILVLCFNVSLAAWLRSRVFEGGELQGHALTVLHFHEWARDLLDRAGIAYARRIYGEQDAFPKLLLDALRDGRITQRYDAVIVDEGQDFSVPMLQACLAALKPDRETFLLALDNAQRIYDGTDVPLSSAGIRARGNATSLKVNHRCSREINAFSRRFLWGDAAEGTSLRVGDQSAIVPISSDRSGEPVEVHRCAGVHEQAAWAAARCQELASQGWTPDEMAVLYASSHVDALGTPVTRDAPGGIDLVALLESAFAGAQVPLHWLSRDRGTKADAVLDHGGVALSTVHSFKGLEARVVVLFGMDRPRDGAGTRPQAKALLYVGMTRATHRLLVPWSNAEGFGVEAEALGG
jgi:superfamily I DNA/RNA helicase